MARDSSAHRHPTVKPEQARRDEVRFVLRGDDLHNEIDDDTEEWLRETIELSLATKGIVPDEIDVELGREPK